MIVLTPLLFSVTLLTASPNAQTDEPSSAAVRCAKAIDALVIDATRVGDSWEQSDEFDGWCVSKWPSQGEPALAQLLDEQSNLFSTIDEILANPSLRDAISLTERRREHDSPSLMETRYVCSILCARSVICAQRGDTVESARRLEQAVQLGVAMTAESSFGRAILDALTWRWKDTLASLLTIPSFDPVTVRAQLDARLAGISNELDPDVERLSALVRHEMLAFPSDALELDSDAARDQVLVCAGFASKFSRRILAHVQLMRSALAVSSYRRERGVWPASISDAFVELDGVHETTRRPEELTCLRMTRSGVCITALVDTIFSTQSHQLSTQRLSITLHEPACSDASSLR